MQPGERYESTQLLTLDLDKLFPEPGTYAMQAAVHDVGWKEEIRSNAVKIVIVSPEGRNLEAFLFLKNQPESTFFFSGVGLAGKKRMRDMMEEFAARFHDTDYGPYALLLLGELYFYRNEHDRAIQYCEALASTLDFVLRDRNLFYLIQAHARKGSWTSARDYVEKLRERHPQSPYIERAATAVR
jgi:hypothetical protein